MRRFGKWLGLAAAAGIIAALVPVMRGKLGPDSPLRRLSQETTTEPPTLDGLDLMRLDLRPQRVMAPLNGGRQAQLTLDPVLQRAAHAQMLKFRIPESGVVLLEVKTGRVLAYASYVNASEKFDVNARAEAPAASVFKVITSAALIERAGLNADTEQCYHGGKSRISPDELLDNPIRDKWCATIGMALGRSLNVVFARLAQKHLTPEDVTGMAGAFGFGAPLPFAVPNEAPQINIPEDPLEFARTAAGFWNTTLSPLAAAELAQTVANGGIALEPRIVDSVYKGQDLVWKDERGPRVLRRAIKPETATELTRMMRQTVENGSAFKSFHDAAGTSFLPGIQVAGKTGTLTRYKDNRFYSWFVGFAPADKPEVAIASLVVNNPSWQIKGAILAREVLRAYFAEHGAKGVTPPN